VIISSLSVLTAFTFSLLFPPEFQANENEEFKILFGGDFSFGENYQDRLQEKGEQNILEKKGYDYSMNNFHDILLDSDYVVLNLETVITDIPTSIHEGKKSYIHYSDPDKTGIYLSKYGVNAVSLANNHSFDFGEDGLLQTLTVLEENEIEWFGAGRNSSEASFPIFKTFGVGGKEFKLAVLGVFEYRKSYDENYNFYANAEKAGVNSFDLDRTISQIRLIKTFDPDTFVIVYPHWGENYSWKSEKQTEMGRTLIDSGADLILGHGAHKIQEVEYYNGKWIVYNLGNFMFNSPGRYDDYEDSPHSFIAVVSVIENSKEISKNLKLYPIYSDNKITNYQPRFLLEEEFDLTAENLFEKENLSSDNLMNFGKDNFGNYIELNISN
jgi:poly-gamma-glutamate capsule biosynthesis protein CapA/YwtB (metallophosphatase superfamily)